MKHKRHQKEENVSFQQGVVKNEIPHTVYVLFPVYKKN